MPKKTQPKKTQRKTRRGSPKEALSASAPKCSAVVGLGASAGGLEAFKKFFQSMPPDSGMAFVLIPHLDPHHESMLAELLAKDMRMPVHQVHRRARVEPNTVYVMPPNALLRIQRGALLAEAPASETPRMPIDRFFRSLAEDQGENAIGIVLSGMGSDGSVGLMAIKEHGGIAMAQATSSARYDSMPRSAITTGIVDHVLPVEEMPKRLLEYVQHLDQLARRKQPNGLLEDAESNLTRVVQLLRQRTGHDFGQYKKSTLIRRIQRRMQVVQAGTAGQYLDRLHKEKRELDLLFKDLLIGVTNFFRDTDAFESLAAKVVPLILAKKAVEPLVRVWVPACSTGEEAYSIAILMAERAAKLRNPPRVQIFATDIDDQALDVARLGVYPESIAEQVSPARLERFFSREGQHFKVKKSLRELLIFSRHNVTRDPPFSRLDLLCCRNLFIYLESELQKRLIHLYHYALGPGGYLFLGSSENMVGPPGLFRTLDKKHRIFQRKALMLPSPVAFPLSNGSALAARGPSGAPARRDGHFGTTLEHVLAVQFAPPSVVVDERGDVVYYCGNTGKFLEHATGAPTSNVVHLAHRGLRLELRSALARAAKTKRQVRVEDLSVDGDGEGPRCASWAARRACSWWSSRRSRNPLGARGRSGARPRATAWPRSSRASCAPPRSTCTRRSRSSRPRTRPSSRRTRSCSR
jgi:two-component system CheB/CheR fusion protein